MQRERLATLTPGSVAFSHTIVTHSYNDVPTIRTTVPGLLTITNIHYDIEEHAVVIMPNNPGRNSHITLLGDDVLRVETMQDILDGLDIDVVQVALQPQHGGVNGNVIPLHIYFTSNSVQPRKED